MFPQCATELEPGIRERSHSYCTSPATLAARQKKSDTILVIARSMSARAALRWTDEYGNHDRDGYVEYERKTSAGLENQCGKDSWNSILFSDGTVGANSTRHL